MSRITKEEIEKTKCGRFLLSDENIYLSIYSLNSYVFEYNLLNTEDRILYHRLQDKFDARLINGVITRVREQIIELFDKDKYIEAKVYFKPKKLSENGELEFRPLHSTGLITQIAIVSMLHLFVYEIPEEEEGDPKLRLSNLSRLIPSDFYGNRVSVKPEYLFKPWKQQYQKYNQNSNDALMKYHTSLEYKYEVTLDLENFFPTINPIIIYRYIINHLPAYLNDEERKMMKRVLQKLLFCKLTTTFDEKTAGQYYKVTKGAGNYDNVDKIEQNEKECWAFKEKSDKFVRGIPQGLPQSYFLGNIYMISIAEIFRKKFTGVSYFYVDDSVIFTNDVREDNFKEQLKELNKQIADEANNFEDDSAIYPEGTEKFYKSDLYGVNVHLDGKSNYTRLDNLDDSEVYLKCISREMSQAGSDFFRMYSDEENRNLEEKLDVLSKQVKAKRDQLVEEKSQKRDSGNEDAIEKDEDDTQKFEKRLTRYYRFFEYRKQRLVAMHQPENGSDEDYKKELEKIIYSELSEEDMEDDEKILQAFMNSYGADIWDAAIGMYQTFADDKEQNVLKNYILKINELCYGKASVEFSYLECTYRDLLRNEEENDYSVEEDIFEETLKRYMTEEEVLKKGCYIRQSYITGAVGSILQSIAEDSIYLRHLPQNYEEGHHIDAARFVMITAAFEWEFRRIFPEGIKKKEKKIKAEETVVQLLTPLIENNTGEIKSILKYLKKCVGNDPLSSKLTFVGMELGNIIDIFGKHLYALNGKKLKYSEMGERLAAQRNNFAHGNLDKDFDELALLDLIYLELILYAMQLKFYGVEDVKIKKAINDLFHKNIRIDE